VTIRDRVLNILKFSEKARNSSDEVNIIYMQKMGMELTDKQMRLMREFPWKAIDREIRRIQNTEGLYQPNDDVKEARYENMKSYQEEYGNTPSYLKRLGYRIVED